MITPAADAFTAGVHGGREGGAEQAASEELKCGSWQLKPNGAVKSKMMRMLEAEDTKAELKAEEVQGGVEEEQGC